MAKMLVDVDSRDSVENAMMEINTVKGPAFVLETIVWYLETRVLVAEARERACALQTLANCLAALTTVVQSADDADRLLEVQSGVTDCACCGEHIMVDDINVSSRCDACVTHCAEGERCVREEKEEEASEDIEVMLIHHDSGVIGHCALPELRANMKMSAKQVVSIVAGSTVTIGEGDDAMHVKKVVRE